MCGTWEGLTITRVVFWPRMHNLNLIAKKPANESRMWNVLFPKKPLILQKCQSCKTKKSKENVKGA